MGKLRFQKGSEGGTHKKGWKVSRRDIARFARALGLVTVEESLTNVTTVIEGHNVTSDADESDIPPEAADAAFAECSDYFAEMTAQKHRAG